MKKRYIHNNNNNNEKLRPDRLGSDCLGPDWFGTETTRNPFSVKDRYQLNDFICIKDFNVETITSLKLNLFSFLFAAVIIARGKRYALM